MERVIILDTETTGFAPGDDRIVEIGCIELVNYRKGDQRQWYLNPDRDIPLSATKVHGITNEQVAGLSGAVTDEAKLAAAKAGPDGYCEHFETSNAGSPGQCGSCGAPIDVGGDNACGFCGTALNDGVRDWVLEDVGPHSMIAICGGKIAATIRLRPWAGLSDWSRIGS